MILRIQECTPARKDEKTGRVMFNVVCVGLASQEELADYYANTEAGFFEASMEKAEVSEDEEPRKKK